MIAIERRSVVHWGSGRTSAKADDLVREEPLEICVNGSPLSVTMRTPGDDRELAAGFLVSEAIVRGRDEIVALGEEVLREDCNRIEIQLSPSADFDPSRLTRHVFVSSSCGLCGKATIDAVRQSLPPLVGDCSVRASVLASLPGRLTAEQSAFRRTGGSHAAALIRCTGELLAVREDVGRHNAVDKVLGWALLDGRLPLSDVVLVVSGRASFEIVQKALAGGIPIVAAVSAPSSLAVEFAEANGQTLVGFVRGDSMNVYCGAKRVVAET